jgi:hypothetical protein
MLGAIVVFGGTLVVIANFGIPAGLFYFVVSALIVGRMKKGGGAGGLAGLIRSTQGFDGLSMNGTPGLGILLSVDSIGQRSKIFYQGVAVSIEQRNVVIDVEIPGRPPYQTNVAVSFPANFSSSVIPGASVEVRVDPSDMNRIAIVGPGVAFAGSFAQVTS